jgi:hypothetical protein
LSVDEALVSFTLVDPLLLFPGEQHEVTVRVSSSTSANGELNLELPDYAAVAVGASSGGAVLKVFTGPRRGPTTTFTDIVPAEPICIPAPWETFPTLCVSIDQSTPESRQLSRGEKGVVFLRVRMTAADRDVSPMNGIQIGTWDITVNEMLTNFRAVKDGAVLGSVGGVLADNGSYHYYWTSPDPPLLIVARNSALVDIVADVRKDALPGVVNLGIFGFNFEVPGAIVRDDGRPHLGNAMTIVAE